MRLYSVPVQRTSRGGTLLPKRTRNGLVLLKRKTGGTVLYTKGLGGHGLPSAQPSKPKISTTALTQKIGALSLGPPKRKNISFLL